MACPTMTVLEPSRQGNPVPLRWMMPSSSSAAWLAAVGTATSSSPRRGIERVSAAPRDAPPPPLFGELHPLVDAAREVAPPGAILAGAGFDSEQNHPYVRERLAGTSVIPEKRGRRRGGCKATEHECGPPFVNLRASKVRRISCPGFARAKMPAVQAFVELGSWGLRRYLVALAAGLAWLFASAGRTPKATISSMPCRRCSRGTRSFSRTRTARSTVTR